MLIGSHVSMKGKEMFQGSVEEALSYGSTALMIYTGAPQNTWRKEIAQLKIAEGQAILQESDIQEVVIHAPYIINLANNKDEAKYQFAIDFLRQEVERATAFGAKHLCLHPGSHVGLGVEQGIENIVYGLNQVLTEEEGICISLEAMAGKGTEIGRSFEELAQIIAGVKQDQRLSVTLDTCHLNDAGYDVAQNWEGVVQEFAEKIGLERLGVIHLNDSKNPLGAHKDRHENIGFGHIGFDSLYQVAQDERLANVPKILETPYVGTDKKTQRAPYGKEIAMLQAGKFDEHWRDGL